MQTPPILTASDILTLGEITTLRAVTLELESLNALYSEYTGERHRERILEKRLAFREAPSSEKVAELFNLHLTNPDAPAAHHAFTATRDDIALGAQATFKKRAEPLLEIVFKRAGNIVAALLKSQLRLEEQTIKPTAEKFVSELPQTKAVLALRLLGRAIRSLRAELAKTPLLTSWPRAIFIRFRELDIDFPAAEISEFSALAEAPDCECNGVELSADALELYDDFELLELARASGITGRFEGRHAAIAALLAPLPVKKPGDELAAMPDSQLLEIAAHYGLFADGLSRADLVENILAAAAAN